MNSTRILRKRKGAEMPPFFVFHWRMSPSVIRRKTLYYLVFLLDLGNYRVHYETRSNSWEII